MPLVVGVRFKPAGKVYYFDPTGHSLLLQEPVIVDTARGMELGYVAQMPVDVPEDKLTLPLRRVIRKASPEDESKTIANQKRAKEAMAQATTRIEAHKLDMRLVDAEYAFDLSKVVFYFTAEGRVDFRELVKDLAGVFRTRVELRQIGVRDKAKMVGGLGCCGRPLCCSTFLGDFEPVSIKMAKEQNLSLNPLKISGVCSRLMCCLKYENEVYKEMNRERKALAASRNAAACPGQSCPDCKCGSDGAEAPKNEAKPAAVEQKKPMNSVPPKPATPPVRPVPPRDRVNETPRKQEAPKWQPQKTEPPLNGASPVKNTLHHAPQANTVAVKPTIAEPKVAVQPAPSLDRQPAPVRPTNPVNPAPVAAKPTFTPQADRVQAVRPIRPSRPAAPIRRENTPNGIIPPKVVPPVSPAVSSNAGIQVGSQVRTPEGDGKVIGISEERRQATVFLENKNILEFSWDVVQKK